MPFVCAIDNQISGAYSMMNGVCKLQNKSCFLTPMAPVFHLGVLNTRRNVIVYFHAFFLFDGFTILQSLRQIAFRIGVVPQDRRG